MGVAIRTGRRVPGWRATLCLLLAACAAGSTETPPVPASVVISPAIDTLYLGALELTAQAFDASGAPMAAGTPIWRSSDTTIATISPAGGLLTLRYGTVTISATMQGRTGSRVAAVVPSPPSSARITVRTDRYDPAEVLIRIGGSVTFGILGTDDVVFDRAVPGAPADIALITDRSVSRAFDNRGDFRFTSTQQPGKRGLVRVR